MNTKIIKHIFAIVLIVPCLFLLTACGCTAWFDKVMSDDVTGGTYKIAAYYIDDVIQEDYVGEFVWIENNVMTNFEGDEYDLHFRNGVITIKGFVDGKHDISGRVGSNSDMDIEQMIDGKKYAILIEHLGDYINLGYYQSTSYIVNGMEDPSLVGDYVYLKNNILTIVGTGEEILVQISGDQITSPSTNRNIVGVFDRQGMTLNILKNDIETIVTYVYVGRSIGE